MLIKINDSKGWNNNHGSIKKIYENYIDLSIILS